MAKAAPVASKFKLPGGFAPPAKSPKQRIILSVVGPQKTGKTELGLWMPGPLAVQSFDTGLEGVIEKHKNRSAVVGVRDYTFDQDNMTEAQLLKAAGPVWEEWSSDFEELIESGIRSVLWDRADELWEVIRLKEWGKLTAKPQFYSVVNAQYRNLVRKAFNSDINLVMINAIKERWDTVVVDGKEKPKPSGEMEVAGYKDKGYLTQGEIWMGRTGRPPTFTATINDSRHNAGVIGMEYTDEAITFPRIASDIFDNDESDWR
jgi:hypothetical protein